MKTQVRYTHKFAVPFLIAVFINVLPLASWAETPEEKGLAIAVEVDKRYTGFGDSAAELTMILRNRHGEESTRHIRSRTLDCRRW